MKNALMYRIDKNNTEFTYNEIKTFLNSLKNKNGEYTDNFNYLVKVFVQFMKINLQDQFNVDLLKSKATFKTFTKDNENYYEYLTCNDFMTDKTHLLISKIVSSVNDTYDLAFCKGYESVFIKTDVKFDFNIIMKVEKEINVININGVSTSKKIIQKVKVDIKELSDYYLIDEAYNKALTILKSINAKKENKETKTN